MAEFEPIEGGISESYRRELLEDLVIPAAIGAIAFAPMQDHFFAVYSRRRKALAGLPIFDMVHEMTVDLCEYRLRKRFGLMTVHNPVLHDMQSSETPMITQQVNPQFPDAERRIYIPFTGFSEELPNPHAIPRGHNNVLVPAHRDDILESITADAAGDTLYQLIDVHKEVMAMQSSPVQHF